MRIAAEIRLFPAAMALVSLWEETDLVELYE